MNIQATKLEIMKLVLETNNPSILESIKNLISGQGSSNVWASLPIQEKEDIMEGINEVEQGETIDYEDLMGNHRK